MSQEASELLGTKSSVIRREFRSQAARALVAGAIAGLVAAAAAAWSVVSQWPGLLGLVPAGAIMAFPRSCTSYSGWTDFKQGTGRMIVGAGTTYAEDIKFHSWKQTQADGTTTRNLRLSPYSPLDAGGEENHILTINEIARHNHSISTRNTAEIHDGLAGSQANYGIDQIYDQAGSTAGGYGPLHQVISFAGGSGGHNTMPPYVALYWCEKK